MTRKHKRDPKKEIDFSELGKWAYLYTVPLVIMEATRRSRQLSGANVFIHARELFDHTSRTVTTPNNDTLYSDAWIDLSEGPVTLTLPVTSERYFSLALMDMYTNNFAILGTRTTGANGGTYHLLGPDHATPSGAGNVIRSPTPRVWALARTLVNGVEDLSEAHKVQDGLVCDGHKTAGVAMQESVSRLAEWQQYLRVANRLLKREPPPAMDGRILEELAPLGMGPEQSFDPAAFSSQQASAIQAGIKAAQHQLSSAQGHPAVPVNGWTYPSGRMGDYGQDYSTRAKVAVGGLGALPREEAVYVRAQGEADGSALLDGTNSYVLHFDSKSMPPVDAFWSLTLYEITEDGQRFFADTPQRRYSIGDRTPGLSFSSGGSLDIWIGSSEPPNQKADNWLPAPRGAFALSFRAYLPQRALIEGTYRLPAIKKLTL